VSRSDSSPGDIAKRRGRAGKLSLVGLALGLAVALAAAAASASAAQAAAASFATAPYGTAAGTELDQLPFLQPGTMAGGVSSFDRNTFDATHGNHDLGNFLATSPEGNVMMDQVGPGCVYRIWLTSKQAAFPDQGIKVFFNGSSTPAIDMTIGQVFAGTNAPFLAPLVASNLESSGGYVSYVPLCYSKSIKITTSMNRYYDIGYETFPPGTQVVTWSPSQSTAALQQEWQNLTADPIAAAGNTVVSGQVSLDPGTPQTIADLAGPDSIQSVKLTIPGVTASAGATAEDLLNNTWIKIFWDGQASPAISAPVGSFFGLGQFGSFPLHGLVAGIDASDTLYMYLPMPFRQHATIQLVSSGSASLAGVGYEVQYRPFTASFAGVGYLKTRYQPAATAPAGKDITVLAASGSGKLVGITASYTGDLARSYLEGDERIYVDGSRSPAFYGTGTEDFYNGAFYFEEGPFSQPLTANTAHIVTASADLTAVSRFLLQEAIEFRNHLLVTFQHGPYDNTTSTNAAMLAYYYQRPAAQSKLTDSVNVGNATSEHAHNYQVTVQKWHGSRTYQYPGIADHANITDTGRAYRGHSQFTVHIATGNQGVILRRRYDGGIASQRARVYVNGQLAGVWYVAGANPYHRWADTDFLIPAALTAGKSSLTIRIQYAAGAELTEFYYWAYSITP
jgi:hypothetical protein